MILAEHGEQVSLHCSTSSSHDGLSVKRMEWSRGSMSLCSVKSNKDVITHERHSLSDFYCTYKDGQLFLVFQSILPLESGLSNSYRCKLHSNQGVAVNYTKVELQGQSPHLFLLRQIVVVCSTALEIFVVCFPAFVCKFTELLWNDRKECLKHVCSLCTQTKKSVL